MFGSKADPGRLPVEEFEVIKDMYVFDPTGTTHNHTTTAPPPPHLRFASIFSTKALVAAQTSSTDLEPSSLVHSPWCS